MGQTIVKVSPEGSRYIIWSSTVDDWCYDFDTREELADYLLRSVVGWPPPPQEEPWVHEEHHAREQEEKARIERRITHADERGSSSMLGSMWWDDEIIIVAQEGTILRSDLGKYVDASEVAEDRAALICPFEDDGRLVYGGST